MDLQIEPKNVDVNMHPTKHEVNFLYENEIIAEIRGAFEGKLVGSNDTRELYTQQLLPGASNPMDGDDDLESKEKETKVYAKDIIRTDSKEQKLEKFFGTTIKKEPSLSQTQTTNTSINEQESQIEDEVANTSLQKSLILSTQTNLDVERKYVNRNTQISFTNRLPF